MRTGRSTRSTLLATREFADRHDGQPGGRVIWMTSGQVNRGVMDSEIAYATSKAALAGITPSVAADLARRMIRPGSSPGLSAMRDAG